MVSVEGHDHGGGVNPLVSTTWPNTKLASPEERDTLLANCEQDKVAAKDYEDE